MEEIVLDHPVESTQAAQPLSNTDPQFHQAVYASYEPLPDGWPQGNARGILQVVPKLRSGGVERGTIDISEALQNNGFRSFVASEGGGLVSRLTRHGATHVELPVASKNPLVMWQNVSRLVHVIRKYDIDLIHARSRAPAWSAYYAAKQAGIPFVTTFHGHYSIQGKMKHAYNRIMTRGDHVIAISDFTMRHIRDNYDGLPEHLHVIPRGVDLGSFSPEAVSRSRIIALAEAWRLPDDKPIIFMPARFTQWKGHEWLIKSLAQMRAMEFCCVMAGDDDGHDGYRQRLEDLVMKLGLGGMVRIVEPTNDMPAAYMLADVVVCPSIQPEAFGRVPVEAAAMNKVVVAAQHGGVLETVVNGITGWLVPPGDEDQLATALSTVISMPTDQRSRFGAKGRQHVTQHFTLPHMQARTLAVYDKAIREKRG
ncbi:glycosyltransferase [bacterium]|nr:glycosyltransferase [bacterium]